MSAARKRTVSLPVDQDRYIDSLLASGTYASESEVIAAGLEALQDREAQIEEWLRNEVLPVVQAMEADPSRGIPLEQVKETLVAHHAKRVRERAK